MSVMQTRSILCFGDSNTHGTRAMRDLGDRIRFDKGRRWPDIMATRLGDGWEVIAEGHPGRTAVFDDPIEGTHKNGLRSLHALLESHRPLDLVIIMLGTNDLKARFNATASDIVLGIQRLALEVLRSDCGPEGAAPQVVLVAPVPILEAGVLAEIFAGGSIKSKAVPSLVQNVAARHRFGFVEAGKVASVDPTDGVHLDEVAHAAIGSEMATAVNKYLS
ncbi:MAG: SGNH/GDSL hydrolase family protein [Paracoccaceae bacterium]